MTHIKYATHEGIVSGQLEDLTRTMVAFSIGTAPYFNRKALATAVLSWRALKIKPSTAIVLHLGGYDDDPRELWEIPQARDFIRRFAEKTKAHEHPALDPQSRTLLLACGADPDRIVGVIPISAEESLRRSGEFFKTRIKGDDEH
ncbi:hypothetical protein [Bradyrhizobium sp. USDA 10063]